MRLSTSQFASSHPTKPTRLHESSGIKQADPTQDPLIKARLHQIKGTWNTFLTRILLRVYGDPKKNSDLDIKGSLTGTTSMHIFWYITWFFLFRYSIYHQIQNIQHTNFILHQQQCVVSYLWIQSHTFIKGHYPPNNWILCQKVWLFTKSHTITRKVAILHYWLDRGHYGHTLCSI